MRLRITKVVSPWVEEDIVREALSPLGKLDIRLDGGLLTLNGVSRLQYVELQKRLRPFEAPIHSHILQLSVPDPLPFVSGIIGDLPVDVAEMKDHKIWLGSNDRSSLSYVLAEIGLQQGV